MSVPSSPSSRKDQDYIVPKGFVGARRASATVFGSNQHPVSPPRRRFKKGTMSPSASPKQSAAVTHRRKNNGNQICRTCLMAHLTLCDSSLLCNVVFYVCGGTRWHSLGNLFPDRSLGVFFFFSLCFLLTGHSSFSTDRPWNRSVSCTSFHAGRRDGRFTRHGV